MASSPWGADAAAPLIGASARGGMGGGGARVLRNRIRSLHTPLVGGGHPTFDMWPLCKVYSDSARYGTQQERGFKRSDFSWSTRGSKSSLRPILMV